MSRGRRNIPLSEWAELNGMTLRTAQRRAQKGDLPVPVKMESNGRYSVFVKASDLPGPTDPEFTKALDRIETRLQRIEEKIDDIQTEL